jgi:hypothetical protein
LSGDENNDDQKVQNENRISPFENETEKNNFFYLINSVEKETEKDKTKLIR